MVFMGNAGVSSSLGPDSPFPDGCEWIGCNGGVRNSAEKLSSLGSGLADRCGGGLEAARGSEGPAESPDRKKGEARSRRPARSTTWDVGDSGRVRYDANPVPG